LTTVGALTSTMSLKHRYVEYHDVTITTFSDLANVTEEFKKLLETNYTVDVKITAFNNERSNLLEDRPFSCYWTQPNQTSAKCSTSNHNTEGS
jgi:hypothetical protein